LRKRSPSIATRCCRRCCRSCCARATTRSATCAAALATPSRRTSSSSAGCAPLWPLKARTCGHVVVSAARARHLSAGWTCHLPCRELERSASADMPALAMDAHSSAATVSQRMQITLRRWNQEHRSFFDVVSMVERLAALLHTLHISGRVHRDLKVRRRSNLFRLLPPCARHSSHQQHSVSIAAFIPPGDARTAFLCVPSSNAGPPSTCPHCAA
jgi:hypothetical protein